MEASSLKSEHLYNLSVDYLLGVCVQSKVGEELKKAKWAASPWNNMEFSIREKPEPKVMCKRCKNPR